MSTQGSITHWIVALREGDPRAASELWERYFRRLVGLARRQLGQFRKPSDEEDVALSAFATFCRRTKEGRFTHCEDRDELWKLLSLITKRKAINVIRHEMARRHGGGKVQGESVLATAIDREPTPEFVAELLDELRRLLEVLRREDETLCLIAQRKFEGFSNKEIAAQLSRSIRTVQRKLQRIYVLWAEDIEKRSDRDRSSRGSQ